MSSSYCVRADINNRFGTLNVNDWADMDNDQNDTTRVTRITEAIDVASEEIDDVLRCTQYQVPCVTSAGATPTTVKELAAILAGLWLFENRGCQDLDREGKPYHRYQFRRDWATRTLLEIRQGEHKRLNAL